jgi:hypothetical protein
MSNDSAGGDPNQTIGVHNLPEHQEGAQGNPTPSTAITRKQWNSYAFHGEWEKSHNERLGDAVRLGKVVIVDPAAAGGALPDGVKLVREGQLNDVTFYNELEQQLGMSIQAALWRGLIRVVR